jgi:hypothetical protein
MLAVSAIAWALFSGIIAGSFLVLAYSLRNLLRGVKAFSASAREVTGELNKAMETVTDQLRQVEEGLGRVEQGLGRKLGGRPRT